MTPKTVITDKNQLERIRYEDDALPVSFYRDHLDEYLDGTVNDHWHDEFEFGIVLSGKVEYCIHQSPVNQEYRTLKAGDGMFLNSRTIHSARQTEPGSILFTFVFSPGFFVLLSAGGTFQKSILPVIQAPLPGLFLISGNSSDENLLAGIEEFRCLRGDSPDYELHCIELVCSLWRRLLERISEFKDLPAGSKVEQTQEQRVRLMLAFIHTHYGEDITIADIASAANVSRSECFRCFRTVIDKSPVEYLCRYRLSQAAYLLANINRKQSEICLSCGFSSPSYFGKLFKENCGMSPGQYRIQSIKKRKKSNDAFLPL